MANFAAVNRALKAAYPEMDIEVVRGRGYVYFGGNGGFDKIDSIFVHPVNLSTEDLTRIVIETVEDLK